jgi:hypothetical protein
MPETGTTWHGPIYFQDRPVGADRRAIDRTTNPDEKLMAALSGEKRSQPYARENLKASILQPLEFARDLIFLPVHVAFNPPWRLNHTP